MTYVGFCCIIINVTKIQGSRKMKNDLLKGAWDGIPIALGYLSVSFGFGIMAVRSGLSPAEAAVISAANLTSAGQAAGLDVIVSHGGLLEMALVQLTINIRYALMSLSLSQKLDKSRFSLPKRLLTAFGITDEIFAVCSSQTVPLTPAYMLSMIFVALVGWVGGTVVGAAAGELLPQSVSDAMGIVLYGMFVAIFLPPARKSRSIMTAVLIAAGLSVLIKNFVKALSGGFAVIICAVAAAAVAALLFPVEDREEIYGEGERSE